MSEPILQLQGITKMFPGVKALNQVQFDLYPGEKIGEWANVY